MATHAERIAVINQTLQAQSTPADRLDGIVTKLNDAINEEYVTHGASEGLMLLLDATVADLTDIRFILEEGL